MVLPFFMENRISFDFDQTADYQNNPKNNTITYSCLSNVAIYYLLLSIFLIFLNNNVIKKLMNLKSQSKSKKICQLNC